MQQIKSIKLPYFDVSKLKPIHNQSFFLAMIFPALYFLVFWPTSDFIGFYNGLTSYLVIFPNMSDWEINVENALHLKLRGIYLIANTLFVFFIILTAIETLMVSLLNFKLSSRSLLISNRSIRLLVKGILNYLLLWLITAIIINKILFGRLEFGERGFFTIMCTYGLGLCLVQYSMLSILKTLNGKFYYFGKKNG